MVTKSIKPPVDNLTILLIVLIAAIILAALLGCTKPEDYCYECHNRTMRQITFCGYSEGDIRTVMAWWEDYGDTLTCKIIKP